MKRKTILTMVFSILGSIVLISGCGAGKTASTDGGTANSTCMQNCADACMDECSHCSGIMTEKEYDCYTLSGLTGWWTEFNCAICSGCFENMMTGKCNNNN